MMPLRVTRFRWVGNARSEFTGKRLLVAATRRKTDAITGLHFGRSGMSA
jgi:hypothetical protein